MLFFFSLCASFDCVLVFVCVCRDECRLSFCWLCPKHRVCLCVDICCSCTVTNSHYLYAVLLVDDGSRSSSSTKRHADTNDGTMKRVYACACMCTTATRQVLCACVMILWLHDTRSCWCCCFFLSSRIPFSILCLFTAFASSLSLRLFIRL